MSGEEVNVRFGAETSKFNSAISGIDDKIDGFFSQLDKSSGQMKVFGERLDSISGKFTSGKLSVAEYAAQVDKLGKSFSLTDFTKKSAEGFSNLSLSTVGAKREVIVLAHEMVSGQLSRMPGSLMVLAERMGGLSMATMAAGGAIGIAAYSLYEWFDASQEAERTTNKLATALDATNKAVSTDALEHEIDILARLPNVSRDAAEQLVIGYSRAYNIGGGMIAGLSQLTVDFAAKTGEEMGQAQKHLMSAFADPAKGAKDLQHVFNDQLNPAIVNNIIELARSGETAAAQAQLFQLLNDKVRGAADDGLTEFDKKLNTVYNTLREVGKEIKESWSGTSFTGFLTGGLAGNVGPAPKKPEKTAGEKQDEAEVMALIQAQEEANKKMERALELSRAVKGEDEKRAEVVKKIKDIQAQAVIAKSSGNNGEYQTLIDGAQAYQEKLDKIDEAKARQAERAQKEAERAARAATQSQDTEIQASRRLNDEKFRTGEEMIRLQVAQKEIGLEEEFKLLKESRAKEYEEDVATMQRREALWAQGSDEWKKINNEMAISYEKYQQDLMKLDEKRIRDMEVANEKLKRAQEKAAKEAAKPWDKAFGVIENSMDSMLDGILRGTQTTDEAMRRFAGNMVLSVMHATTKGVLEWIKGEAMKTAATLEGDTTRTASTLTSNATAIASNEAAASKGIMASAAEAAGKVYESVAAIPYVGWILAPAAAAGAFATVAAYNSFEVGTNYVPSDMTANIHKGERIVPKADNEKLTKALDGGGTGGGNVHLHVHAMDSRDVKRFLNKNKKTVGKSLKGYIRGGGNLAAVGG